MNTTVTRRPNSGETDDLRLIWESAFGPGEVKTFFTQMFDPGRCIVAIDGGGPVAAGYLLPGGTLLAHGTSTRCAMIYAVATLPEYRGRGYGASVVRGLVAAGRDSGFPAIVICPSEDSLFEYYSDRTGFREWFFISERRYVSAMTSNYVATSAEVTPDEYCRLRQVFLESTPHVVPDISVVSYQRELSRELGGGLFRFETSVGDACAVVEWQPGGVVFARELLFRGPPAAGGAGYGSGCRDVEAKAIMEIASALQAREIIARTPVWPGGRHAGNQDALSGLLREPHGPGYEKIPGIAESKVVIRRFGMLETPGTLFAHLESQSNTRCPGMAAPWLGFALD